jgi:integrase/recombinase XerD
LSLEEVSRFFDAISNIKHRAIVMTAYAGGLRISEVVSLRISDIDSQRMVIRVEQGKGRKDRLWAVAHNRSYVPGKVMRRESSQSPGGTGCHRVLLMSRCAGNCT